MSQKLANIPLPAESEVAQRIAAAYPDLSAALRAFADFVLQNPIEVARKPINEAVEVADVSVATANRLARKLGYEGYSQFRARVIGGVEALMAPVARLEARINAATPIGDVVAETIAEDMQNLEMTRRALEPARLAASVGMLLRAERIFVLAFDTASAIAGAFAMRMQALGKDVAVCDGGGAMAAARRLATYGPNDLVISVCLQPHVHITVELTAAMHEAGVPIIGISDGPTSPIVPHCVQVLYVTAARQGGGASDTAVMALFEGIAAALAARMPGAAEKRERFVRMTENWLIHDADFK